MSSVFEKYDEWLLSWSQLLLNSYAKVLGKELLGCDRENITPLEQAEKLYQADFVVVSHNTAPDPIFNYANAIAQKLWELEWEQFTQTPSRLTAEPPTRSEREELLAAVRRQGYIDNYWGVRVKPSGRRFRIEQVTVWNLYDAENNYQGQAATFRNWVDL